MDGCLVLWFAQNGGFCFINSTHTHTKKELLIQLGATFQKTKNAVPLRKHHKSMHKQSDLILTAILVQELYGACSSPHHLFTGDTRVTWELFDI